MCDDYGGGMPDRLAGAGPVEENLTKIDTPFGKTLNLKNVYTQHMYLLNKKASGSGPSRLADRILRFFILAALSFRMPGTGAPGQDQNGSSPRPHPKKAGPVPAPRAWDIYIAKDRQYAQAADHLRSSHSERQLTYF